MDYLTAKNLIETQARELSYEQIAKLAEFIKQLPVYTYSARSAHEKKLKAERQEILKRTNSGSLIDRQLAEIELSLNYLTPYSDLHWLDNLVALWGDEKPLIATVERLTHSFKQLLLQEFRRFEGNQQDQVFDIIRQFFTPEDIAENIDQFLSFFNEQPIEKLPRQLIRFLSSIQTDKTLQPLFQRFFEMPDSDAKQLFLNNISYPANYRIAADLLEQIRLAASKLPLIKTYLQYFQISELTRQLYEYLGDWLQARPPAELTAEEHTIAQIYAESAPQVCLDKLQQIWQTWLKQNDLGRFKAAVKVLLRTGRSQNRQLLSQLVLTPETEGLKKRLILKAVASKDDFENKEFWLNAWMGGQQALKNLAYERLLKMQYNPWSRYRYEEQFPNDPSFWRKLWQETSPRALQLNGACQYLLAKPEDREVLNWLVQQMQTVPFKDVRKIWRCFEKATPADFRQELAFQHLRASRQLLRELAAKQLGGLGGAEASRAALLQALADPALPVQIAAAKALALQGPAVLPALKDWLALQLGSGKDYALAEALKLVRRLKLKALEAEVQSLEGRVSERLQQPLAKTLAVLAAVSRSAA